MHRNTIAIITASILGPRRILKMGAPKERLNINFLREDTRTRSPVSRLGFMAVGDPHRSLNNQQYSSPMWPV